MTGVIRVGRGGAGNFIQQKDVDDAEKAAAVAAAAAAQDSVRLIQKAPLRAQLALESYENKIKGLVN